MMLAYRHPQPQEGRGVGGGCGVVGGSLHSCAVSVQNGIFHILSHWPKTNTLSTFKRWMKKMVLNVQLKLQ